MAKIDIVVPCYNYGRFLHACVSSILDQSVSDLRVLIIDDASTDDSAAVAAGLADADGRVSLVKHSKIAGTSAPTTRGLSGSRPTTACSCRPTTCWSPAPSPGPSPCWTSSRTSC